MRRGINKLTAREVETAKAPGVADGGGLFLQVTKTGARSWIFQYRWKGRRPEMGLGSAGKGGVSLSEARELRNQAVAALRKAKAEGSDLDPLSAKRATKAAADARKRAEQAAKVTFGQVADEHIAAMEPSWTNKMHRQQWRYSLETLAAPIRQLPVAEIDTPAILALLKPIWQKTPETASRFRGRVEAVLDRAKVQKLRSGENPAAWKGNLALLLPARDPRSRKHLAAMPYDDLPNFMGELRTHYGQTPAALELTILTVVRTNEMLGARWDEFDFEKRLWTIPASRMKAKKAHRVPLSDRAMDILTQLKSNRINNFVFPGQKLIRPMSFTSMLMLLRRIRPGITVHGFRSTFRDWASEQTSFPNETCEHVLAHRISDKAEASYRRGDQFKKRTALMNAWAAYCEPKEGKVISLLQGAKQQR